MAQIERCKRQRLRRHSANSAGGMGGADHGARADSAPGCARRREAALQMRRRKRRFRREDSAKPNPKGAQASARREVSRPSHARRIRGWIAHLGESGICGNAPERSGGKIRRSRTRRVRKHPRADGRAGTLCARGSTVGAKRCARCGGKAKALHTAAHCKGGTQAPHTPHTCKNG